MHYYHFDGMLGHATNRFSRWCCAMTIGVAALTACGGGGDEPGDTSQEAGAALYAAACASCHGDDLRGTSIGPSHLSIVYEPNHHPDESFRSAIQNGVRAHHWEFGDMAPVAGLSDDDIDAIIGYVREVQEREGFEPN